MNPEAIFAGVKAFFQADKKRLQKAFLDKLVRFTLLNINAFAAAE